MLCTEDACAVPEGLWFSKEREGETPLTAFTAVRLFNFIIIWSQFSLGHSLLWHQLVPSSELMDHGGFAWGLMAFIDTAREPRWAAVGMQGSMFLSQCTLYFRPSPC